MSKWARTVTWLTWLTLVLTAGFFAGARNHAPDWAQALAVLCAIGLVFTFFILFVFIAFAKPIIDSNEEHKS